MVKTFNYSLWNIIDWADRASWAAIYSSPYSSVFEFPKNALCKVLLRLIQNASSDINALERHAKMTILIEKLKKHGGPLNSPEEIDKFLESQRANVVINTLILYWDLNTLVHSGWRKHFRMTSEN